MLRNSKALDVVGQDVGEIGRAESRAEMLEWYDTTLECFYNKDGKWYYVDVY